MKKLPWIIVVSVLGVLNIVLLCVILFSPVKSSYDTIYDYDDYSDYEDWLLDLEEEEEETTKKKEEETTAKEKETAAKEKETAAPQETTRAAEEEKDWSDVSNPGSNDFNWADNSESIINQGDPIANVVDSNGKWKAEVQYYSASGDALAQELLVIYIDLSAGTVTFSPYMILYNGDMEWIDESYEPSYTFYGNFAQDGTWIGQSDYGQLSLYSFCELDGSQYGGGTLTTTTGNYGIISLVRP